MSEKHKILVVDDDYINRELLEGILKKDYVVLLVSNGVDALKICSENRIDLVLLDIMMSDMDGYEVCKRLMSSPNTKDIPVIFLSARIKSIDIIRGFEVGGVDYVTKPFNMTELLARVKTHVNLKKAREEIKTLRGILPVCIYCKNIRDDTGTKPGKGKWLQMEEYICTKSETAISHGCCPDCYEKHKDD